MVLLPTLDPPGPVAQRIQNAFGDVEGYRAWLRKAIRDEVIARESAAIRSTLQAQMDAKVAQVETDLTGL